MLLPSVVDEQLICQFKYWDEKVLHGMVHRNEIYTLFRAYSHQDRLKAYADAEQQTSKGIVVCITVSKANYCVWLNLRFLKKKYCLHS